MVDAEEDDVDDEWLRPSDTKKSFLTYGRERCHVGFYGWRRRCLFVALVVLVSISIFNLVLTLWILHVIKFSASGFGPLEVYPGGIQLHGQAFVMESLIASKIRSRVGQEILFESGHNVTLTSRSSSDSSPTKFILGESSLHTMASSIKIDDSTGKRLFSIDKEEVLANTESIEVTGAGGATFKGSLQTPKVKADSGHELRLESPTRSLNIFGTFGVNIVSNAGDISVLAVNDVNLISETGPVHFEASSIYIYNLETANTSIANDIEPQLFRSSFRIYQVCICEKGRLFLVPPDENCIGDNEVCR